MIITAPEDQAVALGENVAFSCIASGTNPPSIVWAQIVDGNAIPVINGVEMLYAGNIVNSTLTISDVEMGDFGDYECMADEIDIANFTLYQIGKMYDEQCLHTSMLYIYYDYPISCRHKVFLFEDQNM